MSGRSLKTRLYDIPSLPDSLLKKKYIQTTDTYHDPRSVENFMKETIRSTGPDAPLFEQDLPRQRVNAMSQSILSLQEHGSRYSHSPYHPELFLGDLSKDQRMSASDPLVSQMRDQHQFRQKRYIEGKMQVSQDSRTEGLVGEKLMTRQVKQGFNDTATRMGGIFSDSTNTMVTRTNPNPGTTIHQVGDSIKEDQKFYEVGDEKILPHYSTDIVNKLSNTIGINWQVQPDNKFKVSSISNLYRTKQDVDQSANAVFRLGKQDTKFKIEKSEFKNGATVRSIEEMKAAKQNISKVSTGKESMILSWSKKVMQPPVPTSDVYLSKGTHSVKEQFEAKGVYYKNHPKNKLPETLVEPLIGKSMKNVTPQLNIPHKDRMAIAYQIKREKRDHHNTENKSKSSGFNIQNFKNMLTKRVETFDQRKIKSHFMSANQQIGVPQKSTDHFQSEMTKSKFAEGSQERMVTNTTGSNVLPVVKNVNDFEFDTDPTTDNNWITRSGVSQRMTSLTSKQEYDNEVSPLSDTIVPFRTKYHK